MILSTFSVQNIDIERMENSRYDPYKEYRKALPSNNKTPTFLVSIKNVFTICGFYQFALISVNINNNSVQFKYDTILMNITKNQQKMQIKKYALSKI